MNMLRTGMMVRGIIPLSLKSRDAPPVLTLAPVVQLPLLKYECWNGSFLLTPPKNRPIRTWMVNKSPNFLGAFSNAQDAVKHTHKVEKVPGGDFGEMDFDFGKGLRVKQQCKTMGQSFQALYRLYSTICFGQFKSVSQILCKNRNPHI